MTTNAATAEQIISLDSAQRTAMGVTHAEPYVTDRSVVGKETASKEGTTAIVDMRHQGGDNGDCGHKYRNLLKNTKEARVGQIILPGILPVFGNRIDGYRNSKRMAINRIMKRLCKEEDVGYVDLWDSFVGKEDMYVRDGLRLSGKGAACSFCRGTVRGGRQLLG